MANRLRLVFVVAVMTANLALAGGSAGAGPVDPGNPPLAASCGLNVMLAIDESKSVGDVPGAANQVLDAARSFLQGVKNTGSHVAIMEFDSTATLRIPYTEVTDSSIIWVFEQYFGTGYRPSEAGPGTNWNDAFYDISRANQATKADLVAFITDGDPMAFNNNHPNEVGDVTVNEVTVTGQVNQSPLTQAVYRANDVKQQGSHILAVGVGDAFSSPSAQNRLQAISGPDVHTEGSGALDIRNDDVMLVQSFSDLAAALRHISHELCSQGPFYVAQGGSITGNVLAGSGIPNLVATLLAGPGHGTVTLSSDGAFVYTPRPAYSGPDSFTYRVSGGGLAPYQATASFVVGASGDDVGLVDPSTGIWRLRTYSGNVAQFYYGNPQDIPFMGDWDCDGIDTPGLFRQSDAFAYLRNSNTQGIADIRFFFGNPADIPLAGDFNGDGCDTVSLYRPSEQRFYIINRLGQNNGGLGVADYWFLFGNPGDKPVVGDWDGDGIDEVGLHRESSGFFYYRNTLTTGVADAQFYFGNPGDRFVAGDWGVVDGVETPAVFRPGNTTMYFRHTNTQGVADSQFIWGQAGWLPVAGEFGLP